jgi:hypothetical protein
MTEVSERRPDYERSDADGRLIAALALGGAAFLALTPYILLAFYPLAGHEPLVRVTEESPPRLQIDRRAEELRAAEHARLSSYGWTDRGTGVAHVPIERAMQLTADRGLPGWPKP